ncbi:unnamed protein product [Alternaria alternata]
MGELQWLTHTKAYQGWKTADSGIIWYQPPNKVLDDRRKGIGAAIAYHTSPHYQSFAGTQLGVGHMLSRTLYHQCDRRQAGDDFDPETSEYTSPEDLLWSLICQSLILDCKTVSSLNRRLLELPEETRIALQAAIAGQRNQPIPTLFNILTLAIKSSEYAIMLALDNVHLIQGATSPAFWNTLRSFTSMLRLHKADYAISIIITGCRSSSLEEYLQGIAIVDDDTERNECLQSLHFPEWSARRDQVLDAEKGTNEWLWNHNEYMGWESASSAVLWIEGKPGSGKSVLAKSLQRRLTLGLFRSGFSHGRPSASSSNRTAIVQSKVPSRKLVADWFYSTRLGEVGMAHLSLLRSILYQLLQQNDQLFELATAFYRRKSVSVSINDAWNAKDCEQVFEHISNSGVEVVCIIDAMDEAADATTESQVKSCGESRMRSILDTLYSLGSGLGDCKMKFVVLSRPDASIEMDFKKIRKTSIRTYKIVLERENQKDVNMLIEKGLHALHRAIGAFDSDSDSEDDSDEARCMRKYRGLPSERSSCSSFQETALKNIGDFLRRYAEGVILWVNLIIGELEDLARSPLVGLPELENHVKKLPRHLEEDGGLYEHIVQKLQRRRNGSDIPRARSTFMLLLAAAALGRPLQVRELWEALAVPANIDHAVTSQVDPIKSNRARVKSWTSFRRHLRMICGPFIEIIHGPDLSSRIDPDDIGPDDIVQFIHRTVKDFLQVKRRSSQLHFSEQEATNHTKALAKTYLQVSFPKNRVLYGPQARQWRIEDWHQNLREYVVYLEEKIFLQFCFFALEKYDPSCPELAYLLQSKTFVLVQGCSYVLADIIVEHDIRKLYPAFNTQARRRSNLLNEAIAMGECFHIASSHGFVVATQNLLEIGSRTTSTWRNSLHRSAEHYVYATKNGALATAILYDLLPQVKRLTRYDRHQARLVDATWTGWPLTAAGEDLDPFVQFAMRCGSVRIVDFLFDQTDRLYERNEVVREFAVTTDRTDFIRHPSSCSASSLESIDSWQLGLTEQQFDDFRTRKKEFDEFRARRKLGSRNARRREFTKLKQTCIQLATENQSTEPQCDVVNVLGSLALIMNIDLDPEPNTDLYSSAPYVDTHGSEDESDEAWSTHTDAYSHYPGSSIMETRWRDLHSGQFSFSSALPARSRSPTMSARREIIEETRFDTFTDHPINELDTSSNGLRDQERDDYMYVPHRQDAENTQENLHDERPRQHLNRAEARESRSSASGLGLRQSLYSALQSGIIRPPRRR